MSRSRQRSRELLADVEEALGDLVRDTLAGVMSETDLGRVLKTLPVQFADWLADAWGGQNIYIPMDISRRNARIYEAFTGDNHHELAERFTMSVNTIYAVLREEKARRQPRLPLE